MDEIHYFLGNSCDLNCDFCFWDMRIPDIPLSQKKRIIDEIKKTGIKKLTISGGEPTCNRDFLKIIKYGYQNGLEIILHTHGLRIDKNMAQKLSPLVSRISLVLDGSNEEMNYKMRKNAKLLPHTLFLIDLLSNYGVTVNVKTLITKVNKDDIIKIGELLSDKPIQYWSLLEFNPLNRGLIHKSKFFLSGKDFDAITRAVKNTFPDILVKIRRFRRNPQRYCFVTLNGRVYTYLPGKGDILVGNLLEKNLMAIINNIPSFS